MTSTTRRDFLKTAAAMAAAPLAVAMPAAAAPARSEDPLAGIPHAALVFRDPDPSVRMFVCPWVDRYQLANALLGRACGQDGIILCSTPSRHPKDPGLFVREISIEGVGPPASWTVPGYDRALVAARYGRPEFILGMRGA